MQTSVVKFVSTLYEEDGKKRPVVPENGVHFSIEELYRMLETDMVQVISLDRQHIMIVDEEGKMKNKPCNSKATLLFHETPHLPGDHIVGKALVCLGIQFR